MSKSTQKNGKVVFQANTTIEANPQPSARLKQQWAELDKFAMKFFGGRRYFELKDKERTELHFGINTKALVLEEA